MLSEQGETIKEGDSHEREKGSVCHYSVSFPEINNNDQMVLNVKKLAKGFRLYMGLRNIETNKINYAMETKQNATLYLQAPW